MISVIDFTSVISEKGHLWLRALFLDISKDKSNYTFAEIQNSMSVKICLVCVEKYIDSTKDQKH